MITSVINLETPIFVSEIGGNTHLPIKREDCVCGLVQIQDALFYPIEDKGSNTYLFYGYDLTTKLFSDEPLLVGEVLYLEDAGYIKKLTIL